MAGGLRSPGRSRLARRAGCDQVAGRDAQRFGERGDDGYGWISNAALHAGNVSAVESGLISQLFLRPPLLEAQAFQVSAELPTNVHRQQESVL